VIARVFRALSGIGLMLVAACWNSAPDAEERTGVSGPPRSGFEPVSDVLQAHCGSLDCHGHVARNLRLYGNNGLRLAPTDVPGVEGDVTTSAEYRANYAAVVGLEPELINRVVRDLGSDPDSLTLVRKARNLEDHEGGAALPAGSDGDRCLTSWLASAPDFAACASGAVIARPDAR
jgi:hypothetical protein